MTNGESLQPLIARIAMAVAGAFSIARLLLR